MSSNSLLKVLAEARNCTTCSAELPLGPKPLLSAHASARILLIGQAPGKATHEAGIPWQDRSGDRLRAWLGVSKEEFYQVQHIAIVPTGFCYPGTGDAGDLPPRRECEPLWHPRILPLLKNVELSIYLGSYAFASKLGGEYKTLSDAAADFKGLLPNRIVLPHPSPRTAIWVKQRPWFESELLPALRARVAELLRQ